MNKLIQSWERVPVNRIRPPTRDDLRYCRNIGLFLLMVLGAICGVELWFVGPYHPSDAKLVGNYYQHEAEFNRLAEALVNEKRIYFVWSDAKGTAGCQLVDRSQVYAASDNSCRNVVQMAKDIGIESGLFAGHEPLYLPVSRWGLSVSGSEKGYLYSSDVTQRYLPAQIVNDTDHPSVKGFATVLHHIEGNWYIYYSH